MKAIRVHEFGGPEVLRLEEVDDPRPGTGEVLVRVRAAGVNPVDTYIRNGAHAVRPQLPYTPGLDAAGVVEAVGGENHGIPAGARVHVFGTAAHKSYGAYAQKIVCEPHQVHTLPDRLSFAQGAAVGVDGGRARRAG